MSDHPTNYIKPVKLILHRKEGDPPEADLQTLAPLPNPDEKPQNLRLEKSAQADLQMMTDPLNDSQNQKTLAGASMQNPSPTNFSILT